MTDHDDPRKQEATDDDEPIQMEQPADDASPARNESLGGVGGAPEASGWAGPSGGMGASGAMGGAGAGGPIGATDPALRERRRRHQGRRSGRGEDRVRDGPRGRHDARAAGRERAERRVGAGGASVGRQGRPSRRRRLTRDSARWTLVRSVQRRGPDHLDWVVRRGLAPSWRRRRTGIARGASIRRRSSSCSRGGGSSSARSYTAIGAAPTSRWRCPPARSDHHVSRSRSSRCRPAPVGFIPQSLSHLISVDDGSISAPWVVPVRAANEAPLCGDPSVMTSSTFSHGKSIDALLRERVADHQAAHRVSDDVDHQAPRSEVRGDVVGKVPREMTNARVVRVGRSRVPEPVRVAAGAVHAPHRHRRSRVAVRVA